MPKKILQGKVVSAATDKTASVLVETRIMHRFYKKTVKKSKKYLTHDPQNECVVGDEVRIVESRPISKDKKFAFLDLVKKHVE